MTEETKPCMLQSIDTLCDELDVYKAYLDGVFLGLKGKTQEEIDKIIVEEVNPYINKKLEEKRNALLESLQEQYKQHEDVQKPVKPISEFDISANISSLVDFCKAVKDFIVGGYDSLMSFITLFPTHLTKLSDKSGELTNYTPPPEFSDIDYSKLNVQFEPITMDDITGGAS